MTPDGAGNWVRRNALGLVAIYIALGGTALGLSGRNTVDSGDIENKQVKAKDLAKNSVRSATVRKDALGGDDINEADLGLDPLAFGAPVTGDRIADDTVTGGDVSESTLGQVPAAANAVTATTVNGIEQRYVSASQPDGASTTTVLDSGGVVVRMRCDFSSGIVVDVPNTPASRRAHVWIDLPPDAGSNPAPWTRQEGAIAGGPQNSALGRILVFRSSGGMTTFDYGYYEIPDGFGTSDDCFLRGILGQAG